MTMTVQFRFIDADGHDVTATPTVVGYVFQDYFSSDLAEIAREAQGNHDTANAWLQSAYHGPDHDGIGVAWTIIA